MSTSSTRYPRNPIPAVKIAKRTKNTRTSVASTCRYSAIPPHTPPMTLFVVLRSRRVDMSTFPSFMEDRQRECGEQTDRDRRLGRDVGQGQEHRRDRHDGAEHRCH